MAQSAVSRDGVPGKCGVANMPAQNDAGCAGIAKYNGIVSDGPAGKHVVRLASSYDDPVRSRVDDLVRAQRHGGIGETVRIECVADVLGEVIVKIHVPHQPATVSN